MVDAMPACTRIHFSLRPRVVVDRLAFGHRLRVTGLLGSMGASFFATLQTELLDRHTWTTHEQLGQRGHLLPRGYLQPRRRHSALGYLSAADYEPTWPRQQLTPAHDQPVPFTAIVRDSGALHVWRWLGGMSRLC
jgi:hypothetical protein